MSYLAQLQDMRQRPDAIGQAIIGVGQLAGGIQQAQTDAEDRQRKLEDRLREIATGKAAALQKVGQAYVDAGDKAAAGKLIPDFARSFNQAYGTDLSTAPIVGSPVMKQGTERIPTEQLGPPMPGKLMPKVGVETPAPYVYDTGERTFGPESETAIRGGLLLPKVKPETFSLSAGETRYEQLPGQAPKAVASLDPRPVKDAAPKYVQSVDAAGKPVWVIAAPGVPAYEKPEKADKDTSMKEYNRAYAEWQQRGAAYVNDYVSLMARNSQRTKPGPGNSVITIPPTPEQMKAWREEGQSQWRAQVNPPAPPGGSASTYPFGNPNPPSSGKAGGGTARWASQIAAASKATGVPAEIITAVMRQESGGNPNARSPVGAIGLMQFMPGTAAGMGINPADPDQAVLAGAKYLKANYEKFGSWKKAIAAYNAGPGAVQKYGGVPPYKETQGYVQRITNDLKNQGIEISSADATKAASLYEKYGITPGAANA